MNFLGAVSVCVWISVLNEEIISRMNDGNDYPSTLIFQNVAERIAVVYLLRRIRNLFIETFCKFGPHGLGKA